MNFYLFAFGKLKTPGLREAADYYLKLSRTWTPAQEFELKPLPVPEKSPAVRTQIQEKEGKILLDRIKNECRGKTLILLLDELGKAKTTQQWAKALESWQNDGYGSIAFCIGSSLGFSQEVRNKAQGLLCLGPQTLPHELARVVLLEQIFRAQSVLKGHPYHNEGF